MTKFQVSMLFLSSDITFLREVGQLWGHSCCLNTDYVPERDVSAEYISCFNHSADASALLNLEKKNLLSMERKICVDFITYPH